MTNTGSGGRADTIYLLAGIAALGSLGTQLLVPVLPILSVDLAISTGQAQRLVAIYLVGLACGQLMIGPLFDRRGRKAVLHGGLALFSLGSFLAALSGSYAILLGARFLQALGAAVGIVGSRVLVSDLYPAEEGVRHQSTLMAFVLISPAVAPALGGALGEAAGWRAIMLALGLASLGSMVWTQRALPALPMPSVTGPGRMMRDLVKLGRNGRFLTATLTIAGGSSALYIFLTAAPFLLAHQYGLRPGTVGLVLMVVALASIAGTFAVARMDRHGHALVVGTALIALAPILLLAEQMAASQSLSGFLAPMCVLGLGAGMCGPAGIARVLRSEPGLQGTSVALCGALQMATSASCAAALSNIPLAGETTLALALCVPALGALIAATIERKL